MKLEEIIKDSFKATPGLEDIDFDTPTHEWQPFLGRMNQAILEVIKGAKPVVRTNSDDIAKFAAETAISAYCDKLIDELGLDPAQPEAQHEYQDAIDDMMGRPMEALDKLTAVEGSKERNGQG